MKSQGNDGELTALTLKMSFISLLSSTRQVVINTTGNRGGTCKIGAEGTRSRRVAMRF